MSWIPISYNPAKTIPAKFNIPAIPKEKAASTSLNLQKLNMQQYEEKCLKYLLL